MTRELETFRQRHKQRTARVVQPAVPAAARGCAQRPPFPERGARTARLRSLREAQGTPSSTRAPCPQAHFRGKAQLLPNAQTCCNSLTSLAAGPGRGQQTARGPQASFGEKKRKTRYARLKPKRSPKGSDPASRSQSRRRQNELGCAAARRNRHFAGWNRNMKYNILCRIFKINYIFMTNTKKVKKRNAHKVCLYLTLRGIR